MSRSFGASETKFEHGSRKHRGGYSMESLILKSGLLGFSQRILLWSGVLILCLSSWAAAQNIKMTVGQAGINPGTSLFFIAEKEKLYAKHGLDVNVIRTSTPSAVQAMLGGGSEERRVGE